MQNTLKVMRVKKNYTQTKLAQLVGIDQTTVSKYEKQQIKPSLDKVKKLAEVLDVDVSVILACFYGEPKEIEI